jgi:hypothetical protein
MLYTKDNINDKTKPKIQKTNGLSTIDIIKMSDEITAEWLRNETESKKKPEENENKDKNQHDMVFI